MALNLKNGDSMGFKGASVHTINESGRISIPAKTRELLKSVYSNETLVLAMLSTYIVAYPVQEWEKKEAELQARPPQNKNEANALRRLYANLEEVSIDKQGRILIPPALRARAQLTDECTIVGMDKRIEIWNKGLYDEVMAADDSSDEALGSQFNELIL
ncbi:MAG: division/cell wall cluster transcriptional repressor MraZ [Deferribacteraceae bacterium]|nr:division/cell wall cluster transcriptional repressor MraZ [Deferribacteraceae bacterium]